MKVKQTFKVEAEENGQFGCDCGTTNFHVNITVNRVEVALSASGCDKEAFNYLVTAFTLADEDLRNMIAHAAITAKQLHDGRLPEEALKYVKKGGAFTQFMERHVFTGATKKIQEIVKRAVKRNGFGFTGGEQGEA